MKEIEAAILKLRPSSSEFGLVYVVRRTSGDPAYKNLTGDVALHVFLPNKRYGANAYRWKNEMISGEISEPPLPDGTLWTLQINDEIGWCRAVISSFEQVELSVNAKYAQLKETEAGLAKNVAAIYGDWSSYSKRTKTVVEETLNYSTCGKINGSDECHWRKSLTEGCVLQKFSKDGLGEKIDIRKMNQTAFSVALALVFYQNESRSSTDTPAES